MHGNGEEVTRFNWGPLKLSDSSKTAKVGLAVTGKWVRGGDEFEITADDLALVVENFRKKLNGEINVDYDHASEMPEVAAGGPIPSAGRILDLAGPEPYTDSGGRTHQIIWGDYEPTPRARTLIENRESRYISPAINWGVRDKQTGERQGITLTSIALTNRPFLEELPQIQLSDAGYVGVGLDRPRVGRLHTGSSVMDELERGVKVLMTEHGINKAQAVKLFFQRNPELYERYRAKQPMAGISTPKPLRS